ncbi:MAG: CYTH domain-containing protein [Thiohalomonadales bacterium]
MATEIERKFLLLTDAWRNRVTESINMKQAYMLGSDKASVRVRISGDSASLNIKSATLGITRKEYECPLLLADAEEMLQELCQSPVITKTRHIVPNGPHIWEIDQFHGANEGLIVAEIELSQEDEAFLKPDWIGLEVSGDIRYYNVSLIKNPFSTWCAD